MPSSEADGGREAAAPAPFALTIGVTGHRRRALPQQPHAIRRECEDVLGLIVEVAATVQNEAAQWFSSSEAALNLLSPLADGADQIVAEAGLNRGFGPSRNSSVCARALSRHP